MSRVLVVGWDGATWSVAEPLAWVDAQGESAGSGTAAAGVRRRLGLGDQAADVRRGLGPRLRGVHLVGHVPALLLVGPGPPGDRARVRGAGRGDGRTDPGGQ